jgi:hypothetical protein
MPLVALLTPATCHRTPPSPNQYALAAIRIGLHKIALAALFMKCPQPSGCGALPVRRRSRVAWPVSMAKNQDARVWVEVIVIASVNLRRGVCVRSSDLIKRVALETTLRLSRSYAWARPNG